MVARAGFLVLQLLEQTLWSQNRTHDYENLVQSNGWQMGEIDLHLLDGGTERQPANDSECVPSLLGIQFPPATIICVAPGQPFPPDHFLLWMGIALKPIEPFA